MILINDVPASPFTINSADDAKHNPNGAELPNVEVDNEEE